MKHLKYFKLFENVSEINKLVSDLKDMCLELNDINLHTECEYHPEAQKFSGIRREYISLSIERELPDDGIDFGTEYLTSRWIDWVVVKDVVIRALEYMKDDGWKPSYITIDEIPHKLTNSHYVENLDVLEEFLFIFDPNRKFWSLQFDFIRF
jgi:hypothetical protein